MRLLGLWIGLLIAPAACSSSSSSVTDDDPDALSCGSTLAAYCAAHPCPMTLAGAEQDRSLCPAWLTPCLDDYDMIVKPAVDTSTTYYYSQGKLAVIVHSLLPGKMTCLAGPSTFTTPACTKLAQSLPACP